MTEAFRPQARLVMEENMLSSSILHTTWQYNISAYILSNTKLTKGLVPHKILSPQEWSLKFKAIFL